MRILPVISRLKSQCQLLQNRVETAQSLTALTDEEILYDLPLAFVYSGKEIAGPSEIINATSQLVPKRFHVMIAAQNTTQSIEPIEDIREQIKSALIGWQPDGDHDNISFVEGDIIDLSKRLIWWKDTFETWGILHG